MFWTTTKRIIRAGLVNFRRNGTISVAAVLITTITLSVIAGLILLQATLHFSIAQIKNKVDVTIYFVTGAPEDQIMSLKSSLEKLPEVAAVSYTSADQALQAFRDRHQNDYLTLQALDEVGGNPLGAELNIKAKDPSQYESISNFLAGGSDAAQSATSIIDKVNYSQNKMVIDRLSAITSGAEKLGFGITLVLIIVSILIMFNTIRLTIFISREEIGVMRLVGAGNRYIRGPFLIEGILYGLISALVTMALYYPLTLYLGRNLTDFLGMNMFGYYLANFFQILAILLISGIVLGYISSFIAVKKYLKK